MLNLIAGLLSRDDFVQGMNRRYKEEEERARHQGKDALEEFHKNAIRPDEAQLLELFKKSDSDKDGYITVDEYVKGAKAYLLKEELQDSERRYIRLARY
ncbi:hypothetical protein IFM60648_01411 [Aspergillus lentulus]|uniref:EF-hand domain-containing protein n=1 Tax=Aspergillus lentulus TaxID=293939 RepID=A0ABQ0ZUB7_ASPLE|nr:hypothetical protein IFM60648_01411 [Aspergillus lentulus]